MRRTDLAAFLSPITHSWARPQGTSPKLSRGLPQRDILIPAKLPGMPKASSVAIFSVDPGGTSGCATALLDLGQITVAKAMRRARAKANINTWVEHGNFKEQSWAIARRFVDFHFTVQIEQSLIQAGNVMFVSESFQLREMGADLSPVEVKAGIEVLLTETYEEWEDGQFYQTQTASEAKGFCSDQMLDRWGLLKGRTPHERDALRHLARRLDKLL